MDKCIAYVSGMSYCGSTLLGALLDTQRGVSHVGEAHTVYARNMKKACWLCESTECRLYSTWNGNKTSFYQHAMVGHAANVLVDTSKNLANIGLGGYDYPFKHILLSKHPAAFVYSFRYHKGVRKGEDVPPKEVIFNNYFTKYDQYLRELEDPLIITYEELASAPVRTCETICLFLGVLFDKERMQDWRTAHSHTIAGNFSVRWQRLHKQEWATKSLLPKYRDKYSKIFHDVSWMRDGEWKDEREEFWANADSKWLELLARLGHI